MLFLAPHLQFFVDPVLMLESPPLRIYWIHPSILTTWYIDTYVCSYVLYTYQLYKTYKFIKRK